MPGCRSVLAIARHRGAGVFPPTACTRGALRPPVPGATASRSGSATVAPGVGRAPGGASRAAPAVPGYRFALAIAVHRGAAVFPPTAYTCDAFVPTVSGATASPRRSGTVVLATGRAPAAASRAALGKPGFLRVPETTALSPAGVLPPASCALGGASPIGPEAIASSPWSAITQLRGLEAVPATGCAPDVLGRVVQLRTGSPSASVTLRLSGAGLARSRHSTANSGLDSSKMFAEQRAIHSKSHESFSQDKNRRHSAGPAFPESYRCNRLE